MHTPQANSSNAGRAQFASDRLETASNARIVTLCFDRLDRDLIQARDAIERQDHFVTNDSLRHAQDLLGEMAAMLDLDAWEHAGSLLAVYDYLLRLLQTANIHKAAALVAEAQVLITDIGDAFRTAAQVGATPAVLPTASGPEPPQEAEHQRWSVTA